MIRQDELKFDVYRRTSWHARVERERSNLSASVEATLADPATQEDLWEYELDEPELPPGPAPQDSVVIPPRLSLQSKVLSAQQPDSDVPMLKPGSSILAQFAQRVTSSLAALGGGRQQTDVGPQTPALSAAPAAAPPVEPQAVRLSGPVVAAAMSPSKKAAPHLRGRPEKQRLAGHTTKVRLEAVPKWEAAQGAARPGKPASALEATTNPSILALAKMGERTETAASAMLAGSGVFECAQRELAIAHTHITEASVVVVMLTADPGPVVVQYISLQPRVGFTVHLSAPTAKKTPFNYVILHPAPPSTGRP